MGRSTQSSADPASPRPYPQAIYTSSVIPTLENLDWRSFLGRPAVQPPRQDVLDEFHKQPILITGAGGSIGASLALRLGALTLPNLILLEASESNLYALE